MNRTSLCISFAALAAVAMLGGCNRGDGGVIATVNGVPITQNEWFEHLEAKSTVNISIAQGSIQPIDNQTGQAQVVGTLGFQAMQDLVARKLVLQLAKEEGVSPTKQEVDEEIALRNKLNPSYIKNLQARGLKMEGIRSLVETELAQTKLVTKGVTVTDKEVDEYIEANKQQFVEPGVVDMFWIIVPAAKVAEVDAELAKGSRFQDVAMKFSIDPQAKETQGKFQAVQFPQGVPIRDLPAPLKKVVETTEVNKTSGWVEDGNNRAKFMVTRKTQDRDQEITPERKKWVHRVLATQRGSEGTDVQQTLRDRLRDAKIEVKNEALKSLWSNFEEQLKKQPSTSPTTTTNPGG
ncbi:SurA N-terminal domain-containing protein [Kamptonema cortianum]|nr:SurA N-terminal domain-containing protein [Geitlerinema splendidum]MDK3155272.1 SurA N-terminal domain-containing protein [Kamptonema cortianum]